MSDAVKVCAGILVAAVAVAFVVLLNVALFALIGIAAAWLWGMFAVPAGAPPLAWWECALGLLVIRWILAFLLPSRVK